MNLLIITNSIDPQKGGWSRYSLEIINRLKEKGFNITLFTEDNSDKNFQIRPREGSILKQIYYLLVNYFKLRRISKNVDIVHSLVEHHMFLSYLLGRPFCITAHGTYIPRFLNKRFYNKITAFILRKSAAIFCGSNFTLEKIASEVRGLNHIYFIPNGVDNSKFRPQNPAGNSKKYFDFITVGALKARKGQDIGIEAFARVAKLYPNCRYVLTGDQDGDFYNYLRNLSVSLGVEDRVIFVGNLGDAKLINLYNSSSAFILPARTDKSGAFEGLPLAVLEAAACGLPVISTRGYGAEHVIEDGVNGYLMNEEDIEGLSKSMTYLLENPSVYGDMRLSILKKSEDFSWDKHVDKLVGRYYAIHGIY